MTSSDIEELIMHIESRGWELFSSGHSPTTKISKMVSDGPQDEIIEGCYYFVLPKGIGRLNEFGLKDVLGRMFAYSDLPVISTSQGDLAVKVFMLRDGYVDIWQNCNEIILPNRALTMTYAEFFDSMSTLRRYQNINPKVYLN